MSKSRRLSDAQVWVILNAPKDVTNAQLAEALGRSVGTIHWRRAQLRKQPWACRISWEPCGACGKPLIRPTSIKRYHDQCRPQVLERWYESYRAKREERLSAEEIKARIERGRAFHAAAKERTAPVAHKAGQPWSEDDDEYLVQNRRSMLLIDVALELGRTYDACHDRLRLLRKRGLIE